MTMTLDDLVQELTALNRRFPEAQVEMQIRFTSAAVREVRWALHGRGTENGIWVVTLKGEE